MDNSVEKSSDHRAIFTVYGSIFKEIKEKESLFFFTGWLAIAFFSIWGNTSLGVLLLFLHTIYLVFGYLSKGRKKEGVRGKNRVYLLMTLFLLWGFLMVPFAADSSTALVSMLGYGLVIYLTFFGARKLVVYKDYLKGLIIPAFFIGTTIASSYTLISYFLHDLRRGEGIFLGTNGAGTLYIAGAILLIAFFDYNKDRKMSINKDRTKSTNSNRTREKNEENTGEKNGKKIGEKSRNKNRKRYLLIIPILLTIGALLVTMSRGAWLGFLAGLALYMLRSRKTLLIFLIIIILLGAVVYLSPGLYKRFTSIFTLEDNRLVIWQGTLQLIKDHPLLGIGPGNYPVVYPEYRLPHDKQENHPYAHNIFLNIWGEMGIIGLALYLGIVMLLIRQGLILARYNPLYRGLLTAFLGIMVHQQFDCTTLGLEIAGTFWLTAGLITALYVYRTPNKT